MTYELHNNDTYNPKSDTCLAFLVCFAQLDPNQKKPMYNEHVRKHEHRFHRPPTHKYRGLKGFQAGWYCNMIETKIHKNINKSITIALGMQIEILKIPNL